MADWGAREADKLIAAGDFECPENMTKTECNTLKKESRQVNSATVLNDLEGSGESDECPRPGPGGTEEPTEKEIEWDKENRQYLKLPKCKNFMAGTTDSAKFWNVHTSHAGATWIEPGRDKNGKPTPAPVKRKRRKPEAIKHIVIHEPIAFDRERTHEVLNAKCLGVHYTIDRDGSIQQHADPREITVHAGFMNNESISIEMISRVYMFTGEGSREFKAGPKAKWLTSKRLPLLTVPDGNQYMPDGSIIPGPFNDQVIARKMAAPWLTRRGGSRYYKRRNFILPTEDQVIALYKLVDFLVTKYPNLKLNFPGVNMCHALFGGYRWKNTSMYVRKGTYKKLLLESDPGWTAESYLGQGGITAHARTANHSDGLFYEHYLYSRYLYRAAFRHDVTRDKDLGRGSNVEKIANNLGINHKIAWDQTMRAIWAVSLGQNKKEDKANGQAAFNAEEGVIRNTEGIIVHGHHLQAGDIRDTGPYFKADQRSDDRWVTNYHRSKKVFKEACRAASPGSPCNVNVQTQTQRRGVFRDPNAPKGTGTIQP